VSTNSFEENWDKSREIVRRCGLPPDQKYIPLVRDLLDQDIKNDERAGHEYLRALCALLWANGDPADAVRIATAKFLSFDAGCMIDSEFLICGSLSATRKALAASIHPSAAKALDWLSAFEEPSGQSVKDRIAAARQYFGLSV
jgi:hypothetical protein